MNLLKGTKLTPVLNSFAAGSTDITGGTVLDMQGFEGVMFIAKTGAVTAAGVFQITPTHATSSNSTSQVAMASYSQGTLVTTTAHSESLAVVDVSKPLKRYVSCQLERATQNVVVDSAIAIQYGAKKMPVTQPSSVIDSDVAVSPTT